MRHKLPSNLLRGRAELNLHVLLRRLRELLWNRVKLMLQLLRRVIFTDHPVKPPTRSLPKLLQLRILQKLESPRVHALPPRMRLLPRLDLMRHLQRLLFPPKTTATTGSMFGNLPQRILSGLRGLHLRQLRIDLLPMQQQLRLPQLLVVILLHEEFDQHRPGPVRLEYPDRILQPVRRAQIVLQQLLKLHELQLLHELFSELLLGRLQLMFAVLQSGAVPGHEIAGLRRLPGRLHHLQQLQPRNLQHLLGELLYL